METESRPQYRIGAIGAGGMGMGHIRNIVDCARWHLSYVCDLDDDRLKLAQAMAPKARLTKDVQTILADPSVDAVSINTMSDVRPDLIRRSLAAGKHVLCEKPLAPTAGEAQKLADEIGQCDCLVTVDLFNRNAPFLRQAWAFIREGQLGQLAVIRVNHCTPGPATEVRHLNEHHHRSIDGQLLHDCGMHYVDVMRWFANSEYASFEARAARFWGGTYDLHFMVHGTFENEILFELNNSFCYTTLAAHKRLCSSSEFIGTHGVITLVNDSGTEIVKMNGRDRTVDTTMPYGGKKLDIYYREFAEALDRGDLGPLPRVEDAVVASRVSHAMVEQALSKPIANFGTRKNIESHI